MSININCNDGTKTFYNFDAATKTFLNAEQNAYNVVDFGNTDFNDTEVVIGAELISEMWSSSTTCQLEFKSGKNVGFNVTIDNVITE
jgi:hypothetical protein